MEAGFIVLAAVVLIIGIAIGVVFTRRKQEPDSSQGVLNIVVDPDVGPQMYVSWDVPVEDIVIRKRVTVDVNVIREFSHK